MRGLENVGRHFTLVRSKDAGPFMLTIDFFFVDSDSYRAFMDADVFSAARIGAALRRRPGSRCRPTTCLTSMR